MKIEFVGNSDSGEDYPRLVLEAGDHFEVRWEGIQEDYETKTRVEKFVFEKDKNEFVRKLLAYPHVTSIEVGIFNKIK